METLNVILHGSIVFRRNRDPNTKAITSIDALIPRFKNHAVRAGNWLAETTLRDEIELEPDKIQKPAEYRLRGVKDDPAKNYDFPKSSENFVFPGKLKSGKPLSDLLHSIIHLGRPRMVTTLLTGAIASHQFTGKRSHIQPARSRKIANIQVFTYDFEDDAQVLLEHHLWEPVFTGPADAKTVNLHIFAGHESTPEPDEFDGAFRACSRLFQLDGTELDLGLQGPVAFKGDKATPIPVGVLTEELEDLSGRSRRLESLGRLRKNNTELTLISQLWLGFNPVDDESKELCGDGQEGDEG
jgi:hypothetical protein